MLTFPVRLTLPWLLAVGLISISLPLVSSASSVTSTFLSSSTGTSTIAIGDTIRFEVTVAADIGIDFSLMFWSLSGDAGGVVDASVPHAGWPGVESNVTQWEWNYAPGTGNVNFSLDSLIAPADYTLIGVNQSNPLPAPGVLGLGWFGPPGSTGTGIPSLVGTVTVAATTEGMFQGGAFYIPGIDGFFDLGAGEVPSTYTPATYTVTPEPSTALLLGFGLAALGFRRRRAK